MWLTSKDGVGSDVRGENKVIDIVYFKTTGKSFRLGRRELKWGQVASISSTRVVENLEVGRVSVFDKLSRGNQHAVIGGDGVQENGASIIDEAKETTAKRA